MVANRCQARLQGDELQQCLEDVAGPSLGRGWCLYVTRVAFG